MHWAAWVSLMIGVVTLYEVFSFRRDFERIHKSLEELSQRVEELESENRSQHQG